MKIYLAGSHSCRLHLLALSELITRSYPSIEIRARWLNNETNLSAKEKAAMDYADIDDCDLVIATHPYGYGTISEIAYAIGKNKQVYYVCPPEHYTDELIFGKLFLYPESLYYLKRKENPQNYYQDYLDLPCAPITELTTTNFIFSSISSLLSVLEIRVSLDKYIDKLSDIKLSICVDSFIKLGLRHLTMYPRINKTQFLLSDQIRTVLMSAWKDEFESLHEHYKEMVKDVTHLSVSMT